jgi:3D (Asp-Asp-Asp) domain-containing protein
MISNISVAVAMKKFLILGVIVLVLLSGSFVTYAAMEKKVTVQFSDGRTQVVSEGLHSTLEEALAGVDQNVQQLKARYKPSIQWDKPLDGDINVVLTCKCKVTLEVGGKNLGTFITTSTSVADFLEERKITLSAWDEPNVSTNETITQNMGIVVDKVEQRVKKETKNIKFSIKKVKDDTLTIGHEKITTTGKPGMEVYQVIALYKNGKLHTKDGKPIVTRTLIDKVAPITQIVKKGTKKEIVKQTPEAPAVGKSGSGMSFSSTAYTSYGSKTATGTTPKKGTIAVDPNVIPLGTKLYVEGYGYGVAEDTGGKIKGNIVDVYFTSESECIRWGRKNVKVFIVK